MSGHISAMLLEKESNQILVTVPVQDLSFVLKLTPEQISGLGLYPGKTIVLGFFPDDVEWF
jgi:hypothetical protein